MGGDRWTPGFAFMLAGLGLLAVSAGFEAELVMSGLEGGGTDFVRLSAVPWALGLLFFGYALDHPEVLWDRERGRRVLAAYLLFADGGIHILAIGEHIDRLAVAFFLVLAPLELLSGFYLLRASRPVLWGWLLAAIGLTTLYVASRLVILPFVGQQYAFGPLGLVSKAIEGLLAVAIARELWVTSAARQPAAPRAATQS